MGSENEVYPQVFHGKRGEKNNYYHFRHSHLFSEVCRVDAAKARGFILTKATLTRSTSRQNGNVNRKVLSKRHRFTKIWIHYMLKVSAVIKSEAE